MATRKTKKLSDLQTITSADGNKMIPVVDSNGNVNPIKLSDLGKVLVNNIPSADTANSGLLLPQYYTYLSSLEGIYTSQNQPSVKFTVNGKYTILCVGIGNYGDPFALFISCNNADQTYGMTVSKILGAREIYFKDDGKGNRDIYIRVGEWGEFSYIPFCGTVGLVSAIATEDIPSDSTKIS